MVSLRPTTPLYHTPTPEQHDIIDEFATGADLVAAALAGAGKTETLRMLGRSQPRRNGLYVAYNRAIADDAKASFPPNVSASTAHSLAYRDVGKKYRERLEHARLPASELVRRLGITEPIILTDGTTDGKEIHPQIIARLVMETVQYFARSADREVTARRVPEVEGVQGKDIPIVTQTILQYARKAWEDIIYVRGTLPFTHDDYLKIWQLSNPQLNADFVLLDEAQDADPVIAAVVAGQRDSQMVAVGDQNQAIYQWRGAIDAMENWRGKRLYLSQSFRFGPAIAEEANKWLEILKAPVPVRGLPSVESVVVNGLPDPDAILCRTNSGAMGEVLWAQQQGKRVALVGGGEQVRRLAEAALDLQLGKPTSHPELFLFSNWHEVVDYANNDTGGSDIKIFVKLIDDLGAPEVIKAVRKLVEREDQADVIVSTAHKAKGREWSKVAIASDFRPDIDKETGMISVSDGEARLAYVAVTRAKNVLDRTGLAWVDEILGTVPMQDRRPKGKRGTREEEL